MATTVIILIAFDERKSMATIVIILHHFQIKSNNNFDQQRKASPSLSGSRSQLRQHLTFVVAFDDRKSMVTTGIILRRFRRAESMVTKITILHRFRLAEVNGDNSHRSSSWATRGAASGARPPRAGRKLTPCKKSAGAPSPIFINPTAEYFLRRCILTSKPKKSLQDFPTLLSVFEKILQRYSDVPYNRGDHNKSREQNVPFNSRGKFSF